ncbi:sensor domain-containing diguanylate cyclase [Legionella sp.]|uniref:sensor domain-containing diguanylate cyclase n=1 Tax=Legionella sp. TaxID=459 RepID=UPI000CA896A1|nr:sensor domain-containing diguanylate cyclase [Legionella sp.]PJE07198.1 MAG: sensor domain-containing diguanylate cyclase [Legionella sp.]
MAVFFLLTAIAFFLKGRRQGLVWGMFILFSMLLGGLAPWFQTNYSNLNMLSTCLYLIALIFILYNYELVREENVDKLRHLNEFLEKEVIIRTNELQKANNNLKKLNQQKTSVLKKIYLVEHEESVMNKLNSMLQICASSEETYPVTRIIAQELFPKLSGGLVIYHDSTQNMETVIQWGKEQILPTFFSPEDCFALREGNVIIVNNPETALPCNHYTSLPQGGYICIPMFVQKELIGLIHFISQEAQVISKHSQDLTVTFSNIVKIALVNIKLRQSLLELSLRDSLTGLFNRRYLLEYLPRELARIKRDKTNLITAMLDIDDFKKFNDRYGHEAGDKVLKFIGHELNNNFRPNDMACRFGGEEFLVVMVNMDIETGVQRLERVCGKIKNKSIMYKGQRLSVITVSVGVSVAPDNGLIVDELIEAADQALYVAKRSGKDRIEIFKPGHGVEI